MRLWILFMVIGVVVCFGERALQAQEARYGDAVPVERTVEDVEPLSASLRDPRQSLQIHGGGHRVWQRTNEDGEKRFYFIDGGLVAEYERADYVPVRDARTGRDIPQQLISPGTVFHIGLPRALKPRPRPRVPMQGSVNYRIKSESEAMQEDQLKPIDEITIDADAPADTTSEMPAAGSGWMGYEVVRDRQQQAVLDSLDRISSRSVKRHDPAIGDGEEEKHHD